MLKVQQIYSHQFPRIAWGAGKKIQKAHKNKILYSGWMQDVEKWFGSWDAAHLFQDTSLDSSVNDVFLVDGWMQDVEKWFG